MIRAKKLEILLLFGLVLTVLLMNLPVVYTAFYHQITGAPTSAGGVMDLPDSVQGDAKIYLDGQWEFYWNRFIVSEPEPASGTGAPAGPDLIVSVPDSWSHYEINGSKLPAAGYGSYKLILSGASYEKTAAVYIPDFGSAYRIYVDGRLASESGTVSKDPGKIFTVPSAKIYPVTLSAGKPHEIVIETATTRFSGLYMTPVLSGYQNTVSEGMIRNAFRFILFGIALFSFFNLIAIYTVSVRRKLHSSWMPVMIFLILLRIMLTSEFYSIWQPILFFNLSYESTNEIMYLTTFLLKFMLIFLAQEQCGIIIKKQTQYGFALYYAVLYLAYLLVPHNISSQYLGVIIPVLTYVLDVYLFVRVFRARGNLSKHAMVIFWSAVLVIMGLTIDSFYISGMIYMNMSITMLVCFTVFSFIISWVYSARLGDLYDDFTQSSAQLELANSQIRIQKDYYESLSSQMNQIREIKHDLRHFIGVMNHLADEGDLDKLRSFLHEYSEKTEMEKLPVFCDNVVANSIIGYSCLRAREFGIPFVSRCDIGKEISVKDSDLCIILGNAIENAIDACRRMDETAQKYISVESETTHGHWLFKVNNSYNGQLEIAEDHYVSSKEGKSHGLGIPNIKRVVEQYGGIVKIEHNEETFCLMTAIQVNN